MPRGSHNRLIESGEPNGLRNKRLRRSGLPQSLTRQRVAADYSRGDGRTRYAGEFFVSRRNVAGRAAFATCSPLFAIDRSPGYVPSRRLDQIASEAKSESRHSGRPRPLQRQPAGHSYITSQRHRKPRFLTHADQPRSDQSASIEDQVVSFGNTEEDGRIITSIRARRGGGSTCQCCSGSYAPSPRQDQRARHMKWRSTRSHGRPGDRPSRGWTPSAMWVLRRQGRRGGRRLAASPGTAVRTSWRIVVPGHRPHTHVYWEVPHSASSRGVLPQKKRSYDGNRNPPRARQFRRSASTCRKSPCASRLFDIRTRNFRIFGHGNVGESEDNG